MHMLIMIDHFPSFWWVFFTFYQVLKCQKKNCGRFYHPNCLLNCDPNRNPQDFECPLHECHSCKNKRRTMITRKPREKEEETWLVQCRRCPMAYHKKCLPRYRIVCVLRYRWYGHVVDLNEFVLIDCWYLFHRDISNVADGEVPRTWKIKENEAASIEEERWFFYCRYNFLAFHPYMSSRFCFQSPTCVSELVISAKMYIISRKHEMVGGKVRSATRDHLKFPERPVFDQNEKLPEETEAPEPNASTSCAPMESSASRPSFPCPQPAGYGGWLDDWLFSTSSCSCSGERQAVLCWWEFSG